MDDDLIFNFATQVAPTSKSNNKGKARATQNAPSASKHRQQSQNQNQNQQQRPQKSIQKNQPTPAIPPQSRNLQAAPQSRPSVTPRRSEGTQTRTTPSTSRNSFPSSSSSTKASTSTSQSRPIHPQSKGQPRSSSSSTNPNSNETSSTSTTNPPSKPTIISSLFTGKPNSNQSRIITDFTNSSTPTNAPSKSGPTTFKSLGLHPLLVNHLKSEMMNIGERPTEIQRKALPFLLKSDDLTSPLDQEQVQADAGVGDGNRDVLIHSQTGSGKTLTYLLPILQKLLPLCKESFINRSIGTLAIILVPTRELARQIHEVLEKLLNLKLSDLEAVISSGGGNDDEEGLEGGNSDEIRRTRWIVTCLLTGGSTRNHEKARLRKGCPILVSTPGRLLDHLQNTSNLDVGKCQMLILDEADRLLELGFEETLIQILKALDGRRRIAIKGAREFEAKLSKERGDNEALQNQWLDCKEEFLKDSTGINWWRNKRRTILCSATLDEKIQVLVGTQLRNPILFRADGKFEKQVQNEVEVDEPSTSRATNPQTQSQSQTQSISKSSAQQTIKSVTEENPENSPIASGEASSLVKRKDNYAILPSQLNQFFVVVPPKLRLVSLIALLRSSISGRIENNSLNQKQKVTEETEENDEKKRIIVFLSCTDSVDFHWKALGGASMGRGNQAQEGNVEEGTKSNEEILDSEMKDVDEEESKEVSTRDVHATASTSSDKRQEKNKVFLESDLLPGVSIFRLHGSLTQSERIQSLKQFSSNTTDSKNSKCSILLATSVAARGLDLPSVSTVIQLDSPTEGGHDEYVHRIGRTARVGKIGRSILILLENERGKIDLLEKNLRVLNNDGNELKARIKELDYKEMLRNGFGGLGWAFEERATEAQMAIEKWVLSGDEPLSLARSAFLSHLRAYSTHPSEEKHLFHPRLLHLGHLAKAFALREAPSKLGGIATKNNHNQKSIKGGRKSETSNLSASEKNKRKSIESSTDGKKTKKAKFDPKSLTKGLSDGVVSDFKMDGASDDDDEDGYDEDKGKGARTSTRQKLVKPVGKDAESRMYASVRALGKNTKKKGVLAAHAVDEFQIG